MGRGRWLSTLLLIVGCEGVIADSHSSSGRDPSAEARAPGEERGEGEEGAEPDESAATDRRSSCDPAHRGLTEGDTRRLGRRELVATLTQLLGEWVPEELADELALLPPDGVRTRVTEFQELHAADHARAILEVSSAAAEAVVSDPGRLASLAGPCEGEEDECIRELIRRFGRKAWRRPLADPEVERLHEDYASWPPEHARQVLLMRILQAPDFLFHIERGSTDTDRERNRLTDYEVASRIAFRITGATPDEALLDAARDGQLRSLQQVEDHARRLLETDLGRVRMRRFFRFWLDRTETPDPHPGAVAAAGLTEQPLAELSEELLQETLAFIDHVVWHERGSIGDLFLSRAAFPRSRALASIYDTAVWSPGEAPVQTAPEQRGLLLRAGMLVGHSVHDGAVRTSPILRGVFLRRRILCADIQPPDPELVTEAEMELEDLDPLAVSNREWVEELTSGAACRSCHDLFNPLGFALERFGPLGRLRAEERVFDGSGAVLTAHPIDTHVEVAIDGSEPQPLDGAGDLVAALATSAKVRECVARQLFRFYRLRGERREDRCVLTETVDAHRATESLVDMVVASVANEDIFWKRSPDGSR